MKITGTIKTGIILAVIVFGGVTTLRADTTPMLKVEVRNASGNIVPSAGRIEMVDARNPDSGIVRTVEVDGEGSAVFKPEDFVGFMAKGMDESEETQPVSFNGKSPYPQFYFKVQLTLNADNYGPKTYVLNVPSDSPVEYTFTLE